MNNEQIDKILNQRKRLTQKQLETRQHRLKDFLESNFVSGKWWTIEEVVKNFKDSEGNPYYVLNHNPRNHDRCIALSKDVKQLNWRTGTERYVPIVKDKRGSIKLCENKEELNDYVKKEQKRIENTYKYYKHLESLSKLDGAVLFINQANRVLTEGEMTPIDVYARE